MPYIIVRSQMDFSGNLACRPLDRTLPQPRRSLMTYIEFCVDDESDNVKKAELSILKTAMERLGATLFQSWNAPQDYSENPYWNSYATYKPPYLVLNILESHAGYKVVAANSVNDASNTYQIWTLHSLKPSKATVRLAAQEQPENGANYYTQTF